MHQLSMDGGGGGVGSYTTPFAPYPTEESTVILKGDRLVDDAGSYCNVAGDAYKKAIEAAAQTHGPLTAPIHASGDAFTLKNTRYTVAGFCEDKAWLDEGG